MDDDINRNLPALCCAVCGPLTRREFKVAFPDTPFPVAKGNVYRLPVQPDIIQLSTLFGFSALLRSQCAFIQENRYEDPQAVALLSESERCIASARYALLTAREVEFDRLFRLYGSLNQVGLRPGMEHEEFWTGVLGPAWNCAEKVNVGLAANNLREMLLNRYMMQEWPFEVRTVKNWDLPSEYRLGIALLRAHEDVRPSADLVERDAIPQAYWSMWAGDWEHAYHHFRSVFRIKNDLPAIVRSRKNVSFMLMACIAAIRSKANAKVTNAWIRVARECMLGMLPLGDPFEPELGLFFDMMQLWAAVVNEQPCGMVVPESITPFASLPLAMGAPHILRHTALRLPMDKLQESVADARKRGLTQLARYAASGLMYVPGIGEATRDRFLRFIRKGTFAPLYADGEFPVHEITTRLSALIEKTMAREESAPRKVLYWDICVNTAKTIEKIEPRLLKPGSMLKAGEEIPFSEVMNSELDIYRDSRDAAVVALLVCKQEMPKDAAKPMYAQVLAGHPRLRLVRPRGARCLVSVSTHLPVVHVSRTQNILEFSLSKIQFQRVVPVSRSEISIPLYTPQIKMLADHLCSGDAALNIADRENARLVLASLSEFFDLQGDIPEELMQIPDSEGKVQVFMEPDERGVQVLLRVVHHPDSETISVPGQGRRVMMVEMPDGGQYCVRRYPEREKAAAMELINGCSELSNLGSHRNFEWSITDRYLLLSLLDALEKQHLPVRWMHGFDSYELVEAKDALLSLSAHETMSGWLEIGAQLVVDERLVYTLTKLLAQYDNRRGLYLPLDDHTCLHLSTELNAQLANLKEVLRVEKRRAVLPMAGIPALAERWQGELPDVVHHRYELMRKNSNEPIPEGLKATLREYQIEGFRWLVSRVRAGLGCCLADDMGLGKTVQVLALLLACAAEGPSLVVAPLSVCSNWPEEAKRFTEGLRVLNYADVRGEQMPDLAAGDVVVASYGLLMSNEVFFKSINWNLIVLDEAQYIKNPSSRRFQTVCALRSAARVCLTGTPVENSLVDLWSIMEFLNPGLLGARGRYARTSEETQQRMRRLVAPLILRRSKSQVLPQLPPLTEVRIGVEFSAEERALYESCRRRAVEQLQAGQSHVQMLATLMTLRRMCCHGKLALKSFRGGSSKINALVELVQELSESGHKALVFSQFTDVLDLVQEALGKQKISTLRLDGSTPAAKREEQVSLFSRGEAEVFLISLRAGGYGLNLTAADYVILMDPWWNPAVEAQATSRSHRMGQHEPVTVCRLIAKNTVEERVIKMHDSKKLLAESVLDSDSLPLDVLRDILLEEES